MSDSTGHVRDDRSEEERERVREEIKALMDEDREILDALDE